MKSRSYSTSLRKSILTRLTVFTIASYLIFVIVFCFHFFKLEESKFELLSDQISLTLKSSVMVQDSVGIRASLNRTLEIRDLLGLEIETNGLGKISDYDQNFDPSHSKQSTLLSLLFSDFLKFENTYRTYPSSEDTFTVTSYYKNNARKEILLSALIITFSLIALLFFLLSIGSRILIDRQIFNQSIDAEKSSLASRIFHLMKSDIKQIIALIDNNESVSPDDRILMKTILKSIHGTSSKFIKGDSEGAFSIERYKTIQTQELIKGIVRRKNIEYSKENKKIVINGEKSISSSIRTIPEELSLAISALIDNATDAIEKGDEVYVSAAEEGNILKITILDSGKGIPNDQLDNIFKINYSYDKPNGNGLGLYQSREIINSLGGELSIQSEIKKGTRATISILLDSSGRDYNQEKAENFSCILIEDSKVRRLNAQKKAELKGKTVGVFGTVSEFRNFLKNNKISSGIKIFLDSDLGEEVSGEVSAKELFYKFGFKNITLYTASDVGEFRKQSMPWIKEIISKDSVPSLPI